MSKHRRQQLKRSREWGWLIVHDAIFGWRAYWCLRGRERFRVWGWPRLVGNVPRDGGRVRSV